LTTYLTFSGPRSKNVFLIVCSTCIELLVVLLSQQVKQRRGAASPAVIATPPTARYKLNKMYFCPFVLK
jgi:hypothetical protein